MLTELTAQTAYDLYRDALANNWLRQSTWNSEEDGRRVACALGVLDPSLRSASQCPAAFMKGM